MRLGSAFSDGQFQQFPMSDEKTEERLESPRPSERMGRQFEAGATDVAEWNANVVVRVDLPGIGESGLSLDVSDSRLEIVARRNREDAAEVERYLFRQRTTTNVSRSIILPENVDADGMTAEYEDGVLTVVLPKE